MLHAVSMCVCVHTQVPKNGQGEKECVTSDVYSVRILEQY